MPCRKVPAWATNSNQMQLCSSPQGSCRCMAIAEPFTHRAPAGYGAQCWRPAHGSSWVEGHQRPMAAGTSKCWTALNSYALREDRALHAVLDLRVSGELASQTLSGQDCRGQQRSIEQAAASACAFPAIWVHAARRPKHHLLLHSCDVTWRRHLRYAVHSRLTMPLSLNRSTAAAAAGFGLQKQSAGTMRTHSPLGCHHFRNAQQLTCGVETCLVTRKLLSVLNRQTRRSKHWASVGPSLLVFKGVTY